MVSLVALFLVIPSSIPIQDSLVLRGKFRAVVNSLNLPPPSPLPSRPGRPGPRSQSLTCL